MAYLITVDLVRRHEAAQLRLHYELRLQVIPTPALYAQSRQEVPRLAGLQHSQRQTFKIRMAVWLCRKYATTCTSGAYFRSNGRQPKRTSRPPPSPTSNAFSCTSRWWRWTTLSPSCARLARPHSRVGVYSHSSDIDGVPVQAGCAVHCHENRRGVVWRNVG